MSDAQEEIKTFFERWQRLDAQKQEISDDLKELFTETKNSGFDNKALRAAFRLKVKEDEANPADAEFEMVVDTYLSALNGPARNARLRTRENVEFFDADTGEVFDGEVNAKLIATVATGLQTEIGRNAIMTALDIMIEQEEAEEQNSPETANASGAEPDLGETVSQSLCETVTGGESAAINSPETATTQRVNGHSQHESANAQAIVHNGVVTVGGTESGTVANPERPKKLLRPHCLNPSNCAGYGARECNACIKAAKEHEVIE